jgi:hypothetical protein
MSSHGLSSVCTHPRHLSISLLIKIIIVLDEGLTLMIIYDVNYSLKALSPNTVILGAI